jgi:molybdenum cofactor biosynthesis enzyme MoaA
MTDLITNVKRVANALTNLKLDDERAQARKRVFDALPQSAKDERHQWLGVISTGCAATHNVLERCNFYCTACYLSEEANHTPPLPFEEVKKQLDHIRAELGPSANTQITAGEVTLLPREDLARIVRYARDIGLDPMVMTHGQTYLEDPTYLHFLMKVGGLQKTAIHIDVTQKGRKFLKAGMREKDLHPLRDQFATIIRDARRVTGQTLHASHTMTITEQNYDDVPDVMEWMVRNNDAFRMISFQPTAEVGRTKAQPQIQKQDEIWANICKGMGLVTNRHTFVFGHPDCNTTSLIWVLRWGGRTALMEVKRDDPKDMKFFDDLMSGAFNGFYTDGESNAELLGKWLGLFVKSPKYFWQWPVYATRRAWADRDWAPSFMAAVLKGEEWSCTPFIVVVHNFMSSHELLTPYGQERLQACAFKLPVEIDGVTQMVSMCEMNGTDLRKKKNLDYQQKLLKIERKATPAAAE